MHQLVYVTGFDGRTRRCPAALQEYPRPGNGEWNFLTGSLGGLTYLIKENGTEPIIFFSCNRVNRVIMAARTTESQSQEGISGCRYHVIKTVKLLVIGIGIVLQPGSKVDKLAQWPV